MANPARKPGSDAPAPATALRCAVDEVLDAFASAPVKTKVIARALALGGYNSVPADPATLEQFIAGPLPEAVEAILGPMTSGLMLEQLRPLVSRALGRSPGPAVSGVRSAHRATTMSALRLPPIQLPETRPTIRIESSSVRVVAVSPDAEARLRLAAVLVPGALAVANLDALWDALEALGDERTLVIVDLRLTGVTQALLEKLGRRGPLVLWGGHEDIPGAVPCAARETPEQVAELAMRLLDADS